MTFITEIETLLYTVSRLFLVPVLLLIALSLGYALIMFGAFLVEALQRRVGNAPSALQAHATRLMSEVKLGAPSDATLMLRPHVAPLATIKASPGLSDDLELWIMRRLEWLRIVSRTAPMLGLIATMIPMGPALLALGASDAAAVGKNMVVAFSSVILALLAASICFFILTVRRRWLLEDLRHIERQNGFGGAN